MDVVGAFSGKEAIQKCSDSIPSVILLDLMMPDMDGWEVYQQIRADDKYKQTPVIVVTAQAQSIDKVLGLHIAKVDDYISKPFSPQELIDSIEQVLARVGEDQI